MAYAFTQQGATPQQPKIVPQTNLSSMMSVLPKTAPTPSPGKMAFNALRQNAQKVMTHYAKPQTTVPTSTGVMQGPAKPTVPAVLSQPNTNNPGSQPGVMSPTPQQAPVAPAQGTPQYYANRQEGYSNAITDLANKYSPRVAAPYGQFGTSDMQSRLSDYELARGNFLVGSQEKAAAINQPLLEASQPKTLGPTDYAYNPLEGAQGANQGAGSVYDRERNAGALAAVQSQGAQGVQLQQAQNTISGIKQLLGDDNATGINRINSFINNFKNNVSDPNIAGFRTTLGSLANAVSTYNPTLAQELTNFAGEGLGNAQGPAIMSAINRAQETIQAQQQAVGGSSQSSGAEFAWTP